MMCPLHNTFKVIKANEPQDEDKPKALTAPFVHKKVLSLLLEEKRGRIVDLGAGEGSFSLKLLEMGFEVIACDVEPEKFKAPGVKCIRADLNEVFPFENNSFDYAVAIEVVEHLENPWHFMRETNRIIMPGGKLIFTMHNIERISSRLHYLLKGVFPFFTDDFYKVWGHITPINTWTIDRILKKVPFQVEVITFNRATVPVLSYSPKFSWVTSKLERILPKNSYFGEVMIIRLRNIKQSAHGKIVRQDFESKIT